MFYPTTCSTCFWRARSGICTTTTWFFKTTYGGKGTKILILQPIVIATSQVWGLGPVHEDCEPFKADCTHSLRVRSIPHSQDDQTPWGRDHQVWCWWTFQTLTSLFKGFVGGLRVLGWWGCWWGTSLTKCGWGEIWTGGEKIPFTLLIFTNSLGPPPAGMMEYPLSMLEVSQTCSHFATGNARDNYWSFLWNTL